MLEKKKGIRIPEKLRAILLMEADFNFLNKFFLGKQMVDNAEEYDELPKECYGSRKAHRAIDVATNRALTLDVVRQKRVPASVASTDCSNCYDRLAHNMTSLACQRLGVAVEITVCLLTTIQLMRFFLRTAYGDSKGYYGGRSLVPFQGACQGNGGGPGMFLSLSIVIVKVMYANGHVAILVRAISGLEVRFMGFLFVDDTDLVTVGRPGETVQGVITRTQAATITWHGALTASGGALEPSKLSWTLIDFVWIGGEWRYRSKGGMRATLSVPDVSGNMVEITRLETSDAIEVVGVHQAADGNMDAQYEALEEKIVNLGMGIRDNWVPRRLVWQGFSTMIWPSLRYPLAASSFTKAQGKQLTTKLYKFLLPKMGVVRFFPACLPTCATLLPRP